MTPTPPTHYCDKREALITFSQTLRACISANQCFSDDPCPHAQAFQGSGGAHIDRQAAPAPLVPRRSQAMEKKPPFI